MPSGGVKTVFVDATDPAEVKDALTDETKIVFLESPANPTMDLIDVKSISEISAKTDAEVVVDNTFATPYYQLPSRAWGPLRGL